MSLLARAAGSTYQGAVQGIAGSIGAGASIVGLIAGGALYATIGPAVFWVSAGLVIVSAGLSFSPAPAVPRGG